MDEDSKPDTQEAEAEAAVEADEEEEEEEEELEEEDVQDLQVRSSDNLLVICKTEDEISHLEVYVYEGESGQDNLYVHHDILLSSIPICVESLPFSLLNASEANEHDDDDVSRGRNFLAVGTFDPEIEVWDLDCVDTMLPSVILGELPKNKKRPKKVCFTLVFTFMCTLRLLCSLCTLCTLRTLRTLRTLCTLCTLRTLCVPKHATEPLANQSTSPAVKRLPYCCSPIPLTQCPSPEPSPFRVRR